MHPPPASNAHDISTVLSVLAISSVQNRDILILMIQHSPSLFFCISAKYPFESLHSSFFNVRHGNVSVFQNAIMDTPFLYSLLFLFG